jgi:hypothetical protein
MPDDDKGLPKADDLGEGPETRMVNFPPKPEPPQEGPTGGSPGVPKPREADAVGDNDTEELVEEMDDEDLRLREENTQRDNVQVEKKDSAADPRRRIDESKPDNPA